MIRAAFQRDDCGRIVSFAMTGHSGYATSGQDIVCAGVSAIAQTAIGSLQELAAMNPDYRLDDGHIACHVTYPEDAEHALIGSSLMESVRIGCIQIQDSYGKTYLTVIDE
ncbi:MAG: ribosomal-processing cysteine protease Prp [Clostridiaceae bacterium]|jgi:uncharacterized protein YsxB (DUF464 family)|nr:ribosomal-processing cysteine protease Prp [Clostridiaceae bacterium]